MIINLVWKSGEYPSLEYCAATINNAGSEISSAIIGASQEKIFNVDYRIKVNTHWETEHVEIKSTVDGIPRLFNLQRDKAGTWQDNVQVQQQFNGCIDVDIALTPFTNTLAINRLKLQIGQRQLIKVIYLDLLNNDIKAVTQKYTRLSEFEYQYENVPNDFEAVIRVDELGFVVDYPILFERIARRDIGG